MTIKEIEERCGMTRANIRFYEAEGLIDPKRGANGYRDYSQEDVAILKRIKLLRSLEISLEEIKALQAGDKELVNTLNLHLHQMEAQKRNLERSQNVCKVMRDDRVEYHTLDAQRYLDYMEQNPEEEKELHNTSEIAKDVLPRVVIPWRRYFARNLDMNIYGLVWTAFMQLIMNMNISETSWGMVFVNWLVGNLLMTALLEPALLAIFGTTLGKWIFGISITDRNGRKLSYTAGGVRTISVLWYGWGLGIPIFCWIRLWKSLSDYESGNELKWEYDSDLYVEDRKNWRIGVFVAAMLCEIVLEVLVNRVPLTPRNTGDITVAEFAENYNRFSEFLGLEVDYYLDENGMFKQYDYWPKYNFGNYVTFEYQENDGIMTGLSFSGEDVGKVASFFFERHHNEMGLAVLAFVQAQADYPLFDEETKRVADYIFNNLYQDFEFTLHGVHIKYDVEFDREIKMDPMGIRAEDEKNTATCSYEFKMELLEE